MTKTERINPVVNSETEIFWNGCKQHQLRFQSCTNCGLIRWPPSFLCPNCHSAQFEIIISSGKGRIYTYAVFHKCYHDVFINDIPYVTAVIELKEGIKFLTRLIAEDISKVACEEEVELFWDETTADFPIPLFRLIH